MLAANHNAAAASTLTAKRLNTVWSSIRSQLAVWSSGMISHFGCERSWVQFPEQPFFATFAQVISGFNIVCRPIIAKVIVIEHVWILHVPSCMFGRHRSAGMAAEAHMCYKQCSTYFCGPVGPRDGLFMACSWQLYVMHTHSKPKPEMHRIAN